MTWVQDQLDDETLFPSKIGMLPVVIPCPSTTVPVKKEWNHLSVGEVEAAESSPQNLSVCSNQPQMTLSAELQLSYIPTESPAPNQ